MYIAKRAYLQLNIPLWKADEVLPGLFDHRINTDVAEEFSLLEIEEGDLDILLTNGFITEKEKAEIIEQNVEEVVLHD